MQLLMSVLKETKSNLNYKNNHSHLVANEEIIFANKFLETLQCNFHILVILFGLFLKVNHQMNICTISKMSTGMELYSKSWQDWTNLFLRTKFFEHVISLVRPIGHGKNRMCKTEVHV